MRAALVFAMIAAAAPAHAKRDRTVSGDVIKAARYIQSARLADARVLLADLEKRAPGTAEVKWLAAELAFQSGEYADAIRHLDKLADTAVDGLVGSTRKLASSTMQVTAAFVEVKSPKGRFVIRHAPGPDAAIAGLTGEVLDAAWDAIGDDLGLKPPDPIRVELLGAPADLAKLSPLTESDIETTGTIALSKYNKLMVVSPRATLFGYPWMDTLAHEYTHLVISRLSFDSVPVWLHEGLARFEQTRWRAQPELRLSATEHALLASALKKGRLITFDEMHPSMAKLPSQDAAALAYAEVYTLVAWLHGKLGYAGLRDVIASQRDGKSARRAVAETLSLSWPAVEKSWHTYLKAQPAPGARAGKPIKFDRGGVDSENVGLEQVGARARKHARLGGILRARGMLDAAVVEYERALAVSRGDGPGRQGAADGADPFVAGKLARTLVELGLSTPATPATPAAPREPAPGKGGGPRPIERAIELATPLVAADPHDAVAAVTLGMARATRHEWPQAIAAYEQALRVSPFDPTTRCGLAEAYSKMSDSRAGRERAACDQLKR